VPHAVDPAQTILRIDLVIFNGTRNVGRDRRPPSVLNSLREGNRQAIAEATRCQLPYVRADWFVAVGSRPPLYHDILPMPRSESELGRCCGDTLGNISPGARVRAGFNSSGVSAQHRLIERHEIGRVVYWKS